jgi:hypothetical protein
MSDQVALKVALIEEMVAQSVDEVALYVQVAAVDGLFEDGVDIQFVDPQTV